MVNFYKTLKKNMPRLGSLLYRIGLVFLVFQLISSSLFAILEEDEAQLTECLKKRLTDFKNPWDRGRNENQIQALYKKIREHYEPLAPQDPEAAITLGNYIALVEDGEEGLSHIRPFADQGNARAQYLTGFILCQMDRKKEAMEAFADAAIQGQQQALEHLKIYANRLKNPHALLQLSRFYISTNDRAAEAQCLEQIIDDPVLQLPKPLIQGHLRYLHGDFENAMKIYREVAATNSEQAQPYVDRLFQDPDALFHLLKANAFQDGELEKGQSLLVASIGESEDKRVELQSLPPENLNATYIYGCVLLKDRKSNKKKPPLSWANLDPLVKAARANHRLAELKLKEVVNQQNKPELWYHYGRFLLERKDQKNGLVYIKKAAAKNYKPATDHLGGQKKNKKNLPLAAPPKQTPKNLTPSTAPKASSNWFLIGCQLEESKKWAQAIDAFEKVNGSQRLDAAYHLGRLYTRLFKENKDTQPEEALKQAKKAHEFLDHLGDKHPGALYTRGKLFYLEQETEKAKEKWGEALKLGYSAANYRLGILYSDTKETMEKAREYFRRAGRQGIPKSYFRAARVSLAMNDLTSEAEDLYFGALAGHAPCVAKLNSAANNGSLPATFNLGAYYFGTNQLIEARACWDQVSVSPENSEYAGILAYNYAKLALREDKVEEAINLFMDSTQLGYGPAYAALAKTFWEKKNDVKVATEFYQLALEINPNNGKIIQDVALFHYAIGNIDFAISKAAQASLEGEQEAFKLLNKIYNETHSPLAALNLGSVLLQFQRTVEAKKHWKKALESTDFTIKSAAHYNLCMTTFIDGDLVKTVKLVRKAIDDGETSIIKYLEGFAYSEDSSPVKKEKKASAIKVLKKLGLLSKETN
jgi:predicted negative regulator of RcsB-dependent stress response